MSAYEDLDFIPEPIAKFAFKGKSQIWKAKPTYCYRNTIWLKTSCHRGRYRKK